MLKSIINLCIKIAFVRHTLCITLQGYLLNPYLPNTQTVISPEVNFIIFEPSTLSNILNMYNISHAKEIKKNKKKKYR